MSFATVRYLVHGGIALNLVWLLAVFVPIISGLAGGKVIRLGRIWGLLLGVGGILVWELHELPLTASLLTSVSGKRELGGIVSALGVGFLVAVVPYLLARQMAGSIPWKAIVSGTIYCIDLCICAGLIGWNINLLGPIFALAILETAGALAVPLVILRKTVVPPMKFAFPLLFGLMVGSYLGIGVSLALGLGAARA